MSPSGVHRAPVHSGSEATRAFDYEHGRLYEALKTAEERAELAGDDDIASDIRILRKKVALHISRRSCGA